MTVNSFIEHFIFITNGFEDGKRYCLHLAITDDKTEKKVRQAIGFYSKNKRVSAYTIVTKSDSWESVVESDPFYQELIVFDWNKDADARKQFEQKVYGNKLNAFDVVLLLLSQRDMTYIETIMFLILVYNRYNSEHKNRLFEEKIIFNNQNKELIIESLEGRFFENFGTCFKKISDSGFQSFNNSCRRYNYTNNEILFSKVISSGVDISVLTDVLKIFNDLLLQYSNSPSKLFRMLFLQDPYLEEK